VRLLHEEMLDFVAYVDSMTAARLNLVRSVHRRIQKTVVALWPSAHVHRYGSFSTGLAVLQSDLDLVVTSAPAYPALEKSPLAILGGVLRQQRWCRHVQNIDTAHMPVIKLECVDEEARSRPLQVDITFDFASSPSYDGGDTSKRHRFMAHKHRGLTATQLVRDAVLSLPSLKPLALLLKQYLYEQGLSDTYTGGLSSYCLVIMIISFLRAHVPSLPPSRAQTSNLGAMLLEFLTFFGQQFEYHKMGITLRNGGGYFYLGVPCPTLVIEDPFDPRNNIGKSVFAMYRIKGAFNHALQTLLQPRTTPYTSTRLSRIISGKSQASSSGSAATATRAATMAATAVAVPYHHQRVI